ncbi:hypothetical protein EZS27_034288, partial [termite gut metagenome]
PDELRQFECPLCEANSTAYGKYLKAIEVGNDFEKKQFSEISLRFKANDCYIVRVIDRDHEEDGPKFWRINAHTKKKDGLYDQIMSIYNGRLEETKDSPNPTNIFDLETGKDLKITVTRVENNKKTSTIMDCGEKTPLHADEETAIKWLENNEVKWYEAYSVKAYEYLQIVGEGKVPFFDKKENVWITEEAWREKYQKSRVSDNDLKDALNGGVAVNIPNKDYVAPTTAPITENKATTTTAPTTKVVTKVDEIPVENAGTVEGTGTEEIKVEDMD